MNKITPILFKQSGVLAFSPNSIIFSGNHSLKIPLIRINHDKIVITTGQCITQMLWLTTSNNPIITVKIASIITKARVANNSETIDIITFCRHNKNKLKMIKYHPITVAKKIDVIFCSFLTDKVNIGHFFKIVMLINTYKFCFNNDILR